MITLLVLLSVILEGFSYYKQIVKTRLTHHSKDISTSSYFAKLAKYVTAILALVLSHNWVGLILECFALVMCIITTIIIIKNKPDDWSVF